MGLPEPPVGISPQIGEQSEPLDLRTNNNCVCKSPPFKKLRYWFYQSEPLDLTVRKYNVAFTETESSQSNVLTPNQQRRSSVHQFKKLLSKCYSNEYNADTKYTSKSNACALFSLDLSDKNNQTSVSEDNINAENAENISESISCAIVPSSLSVEEIGKTSVGVKVVQTLESLSVQTYHNSSNEIELEPSETVKHIPVLLECNTIEKLTINTDNLSINKQNRDYSSKYLHKIEKSSNKSNKSKRINKRKVKKESLVSIMAINQELAVNECENNNKSEYLKSNVEAGGVHGIVKNLGQDEEPSPKKLCFETSVSTLTNLFTKPSVKKLKKTGESFLQDGKCFEVAPKLPRCRECSEATQDSKTGKTVLGSDNVLCRFYAFRKLRYSTKGFLATAGFLDPRLDTTQEDLRLWQPMSDEPLPEMDLQMARFMLSHVGDQFCDLCRLEEEAVSIHMSEDKKAVWKRPVPGYREMCDVCNTTLFNYHWTCRTCGFAVCIDCFKARKGCMPEIVTVERPWLICVNKRAHDQQKMMLTQIIAADSLKYLKQKAHEIRTSIGLPLHCCGCPSFCPSTTTCSQSNDFQNEFSAKEKNIDGEVVDKYRTCKEDSRGKILHPDSFDDITNHLPSSNKDKNIDGEVVDKYRTCKEDSRKNILHPDTFNDITNHLPYTGTGSNKDKTLSFEDYCSVTENYLARLLSSLRMCITKTHLKNSMPENSITHEELILTVFDQAAVDDAGATVVPLVRHYNTPPQCRGGPIPTRVMTLTDSRILYPDCPHSWLCEGRLLKLSDPSHAGNYPAFQDQWKRGQPVVVSGVLKYLDEGLWQPDSFIRDFGDTKNDLVNCMTGRVIPGQYMRRFWEGFQEVSKMLKDDKGKPMLLKLKDWPPGEDFAEMLPKRFEDLMNALPMGEYTKRTGQLNLPSRLPSIFARPDLGPKMYIAYGSAIHPTKGTTNLHLDISDAVNVMVYVGIPNDIDREEYIKEAYRAVDEACFEVLMRRRVRGTLEVPGALWHIYSARDTDKIRHLLTRVARERKTKLGPHQDPIHDQSWYLDAALRQRLYNEYDVRGYAIVQCLGDAVFIPAGAPHQVRNLLNCIKVAEDFVSPENLSHCLHLTQEFRKLSDFHSNHEDKLQIKNIIYHAMKDSVSVLSQ